MHPTIPVTRGSDTDGSSSAYKMEALSKVGKMQAHTRSSPKIERGLILMDPSRAIIALDRGAAAILNYRRDRSGKPNKNVQEVVRHAGVPDPFCLERVFRLGIEEFTCRTYLLESRDESVPQPLTALLLERHREARDEIDEIGDRYHLTGREQQALRGLSLGLGTKDLASRMDIRPSTLRAFLRLIKIKMGETSRAGVIAKILEKRQP